MASRTNAAKRGGSRAGVPNPTGTDHPKIKKKKIEPKETQGLEPREQRRG